MYGIEDEDRFLIDKSYVTQIEYRQDEVIYKLVDDYVFTLIYIKKFVPNKERLINELINRNNNLVITEGCTDWKHLKSALIHFNEEKKYENLDFKFLEYENSLSEKKELAGNKTLDTICEYVSLFKNDYKRIFVFDADDREINEKYKSESGYKYLGNNVYVIILPVPDFRKNTPLISIENYYTDKEIKTKDINGCRLYISDEFSVDGIRNEEGLCTLKYDKERPNLIIDTEVYEIDNNDCIKCKKDINEKRNKLKKAPILSKNNFAKNILGNISPFNSFSKDNFSLFFDILENILKNNYEEDLNLKNEVSISPNTKIKIYPKHYEMHIQVWDEEDVGIVNRFRETGVKFQMIDFVNNQVHIGCGYSYDKCYITAMLGYSDLLREFIEQKINNPFNNRIYLHIFDNNKIHECSFEILNGDNGYIQFSHLIKKIKSLINNY